MCAENIAKVSISVSRYLDDNLPLNNRYVHKHSTIICYRVKPQGLRLGLLNSQTVRKLLFTKIFSDLLTMLTMY